MLRKLDIRNYVLIDSLEIDFPGSLVIITGQTGAGKSILLGALSLLMGVKADASVIGEASDNCVVEGDFDVDAQDTDLRELLDENDVDWDDGHILIRRVISSKGRSRAFVNDSPVALQVLLKLSSRLLDIHSQHQTLLLSDKGFQLSLLDYFAGNAQKIQEYKTEYQKFLSIRSEISSLEETLDRAKRDAAYNQARLERLQSASLRDGEVEELEAEQKQLENAGAIKESLFNAEHIISSLTFNGEEYSVMSALKDARRSLEKVSDYVPAIDPLVQRLESSRVELEDIFSELSQINSSTVVSQERLDEVDSRLSLIYSLMQSFSCSTVTELISQRDMLASEVADMSSAEEKLQALKASSVAVESSLVKMAADLSVRRKEAAEPFMTAIQSSIRFLEMPEAIFRIELETIPLGKNGTDGISFLFSSTGRGPVDVAKCASGGEMSRIMLAMKAMMARYASMPTMIFDEIDTGVSGSVADKMGSMICEMGKYMQVFAITHLPQVAAKGDAHYLVSKSSDGSGRTVSKIKRLSDEQRVLEIARMLSGSVLTEAAIENARSLLS